MKNPLKFFQEVKQEAFKVTWPTAKETVQGALMVFAMAVLASIFFLLLDQILKFILEIMKSTKTDISLSWSRLAGPEQFFFIDFLLLIH